MSPQKQTAIVVFYLNVTYFLFQFPFVVCFYTNTMSDQT